LTQNTHDAVVRLLSALPLRSRPRVVTTDGEFHSLDRQLRRLAEEGLEVVRVPARPVVTLAERLAAVLRADPARTSLVATSSVLFQTAEIVPHLPELARACDDHGVPLLLDTYHHLGAVPFTLRGGLERAFVTGGGYKYLQLGEGNCFLRAPAEAARALRPVVTGWFAAFGHLDAARDGDARVPYDDGHARFAGSTYDPSSHYRAAAVLDFFDEQRLTPALLREVSVHQTTRLRDGLAAAGLLGRAFDLAAPDPARVAGFLALRTPAADVWSRHLADRGVLTDSRGEILRLGPAPYLSDAQLDEAVGVIADVARELAPT
ncbi:MAG: kynureninase, partial [Myxococcales bacterium]|nr:kynureninase [Myxococcales bacterium]